MHFKQINPSLGFCTVFSQEPPTVPTRLKGCMAPSGSLLSYQLSRTEGNFNAITNFPALQDPELLMSPSLTFPLPVNFCTSTVVKLQMPLTNEEDQFINKLKVSNPSITEQEAIRAK